MAHIYASVLWAGGSKDASRKQLYLYVANQRNRIRIAHIMCTHNWHFMGLARLPFWRMPMANARAVLDAPTQPEIVSKYFPLNTLHIDRKGQSA